MHRRFPFYSIACTHALSLNTPVAIMLGRDNCYWVVDRHERLKYLNEGFVLILDTP